MLAFFIAFFALLMPFVTTNGARNASIGVDDYVVDLGYQLNRGQAVVVGFVYYELPTTSHMHPSDANEPKLTNTSGHYF